jgi:hypothetical protein
MKNARNKIKALAGLALAVSAMGSAVQAAPAAADVPVVDGPSLGTSTMYEGYTYNYRLNWTCPNGYRCDLQLYATKTPPRTTPSDFGTAFSGSDFSAPFNYQQNLVPGRRTSVLPITINADGIAEGQEFFYVKATISYRLCSGCTENLVKLYAGKVFIPAN